MHAVLVETPFVFWYFDMLPVKCIVEAGGHSRAVNDTGIVVIDAVQIKVRSCYAVCCVCVLFLCCAVLYYSKYEAS